MRKVFYILGFLAALEIIVVVLFVRERLLVETKKQNIKPWVTYSRLQYIAGGCEKYKKEKGEWPSSVAHLVDAYPQLYDSWCDDAWGRTFVLIPYKEPSGYGSLLSYGCDGKPGGVGTSRDLEFRFPTNAYVAWNQNQALGIKQPDERP